jgi:hypothetical protein
MLRAFVRLWIFSVLLFAQPFVTLGGPFAPAAGQPGSDAIGKDDPRIKAWATSVEELARGPMNISNPGLGNASFGVGANALGPAQGTATDVVSLGDGGWITLSFASGIRNGPGPDLAVFENGFADVFLELAFVEVSSNGTDFFRFPAISLTQTATQVGSFDPLDPTNLYNLAGKYRAGFGTPFDLAELAGVSPLLDVNHVTYVRIVDVVGSINPLYATHDSLGGMVNDPWPTPFASSGFDLDAVGVLHVVPEPSTWALGCLGLLILVATRAATRRKRIGATLRGRRNAGRFQNSGLVTFQRQLVPAGSGLLAMLETGVHLPVIAHGMKHLDAIAAGDYAGKVGHADKRHRAVKFAGSHDDSRSAGAGPEACLILYRRNSGPAFIPGGARFASLRPPVKVRAVEEASYTMPGKPGWFRVSWSSTLTLWNTCRPTGYSFWRQSCWCCSTAPVG